MKRQNALFLVPAIFCCVFLPSSMFAATRVAAKTSASKAAQAAATAPRGVPDIPTAPVPESVFKVPANLQEGRNPFFPQPLPEPTRSSPSPRTVDRTIVLNGITSPPKPTAMINGSTFEEGESGDIKLQDGSRLPILCIEIKAQSAIIEVEGQRREIRLRGTN